MTDPLLPPFVALPGKADNYGHWQGGPAPHDGAYCDTCDRPLLLIWDLDCSDHRFLVDGRSPFGELGRIPLYFCWGCGATLAYELFGDDIERIEDLDLVESRGKDIGTSFPYNDYPTEFPRRTIRLIRNDEFPEDIQQFLDNWAKEERTELTENEKSLLTQWLCRKVEHPMNDLWWHQLGGDFHVMQGTDDRPCPNDECEANGAGIPMKLLAAIKNDPMAGLPMIETESTVAAQDGFFNSWVQLVFYFCDQCYTIRAAQDCT